MADRTLKAVLNEDTMENGEFSGTMTAADIALGTLGTKANPIDDDKVIQRDSADSDAIKTSTWTQIKAFLKTYFDTLYNKYVHPNHSGEVTSVADGAQTITAKAVTYAKIQDISATDKLLGRSTVGAGVTEEIACTSAGRAILDDADAAAQRATLGVTSDTAYASSWNGVLDVAPSKNAVYDAYGTLFPTHYERANRPARSAVDTLTLYSSTVVNVNEKIFTVDADTDLELNTNAIWDTGTALNDAARAGHDYYVYACDNAGTLALLVSADSTNPTGYTSVTSRKIGGFHCLCVAVGTIAGHTLTDFTQGDILPQSVWDLNFRPESEPEGMVWSDAAQVWVDIYLASGTGASTVSANGGTISDTRDWMDFVDDFGAVKKQLLDDVEFQLIAAGSNEETNITGSADPVTTGGHVDTAARRMISNIGCEDCAGALHQWLSDTSAKYDGAVVAGWLDLPGGKGSFYRPVDTNEIKLLAGGHWTSAADCGSRCRSAHIGRVAAVALLGGRGRSRKL